MSTFDLASILLLLLLLFIFLGGFYLLKIIKIDASLKKHKTTRTNKQACDAIKREIFLTNWTDYFWSNHMRAAWIMLFLIFSIALSFALATIWTILIGILFMVITFFFLRFAIRSYKAFPDKAAQALKTFEEEVKSSLENEISFNGDNIQSFTNEDENFDTKPKIFSFTTLDKKLNFPPHEAKKTIVSSKKVDFLVLSREYFSICKNAATFNLLNPTLEPEKKGCAKKKGAAGECNEHYYSQMRNVEYDNDEECIRIIYYDERDDVEFTCKKKDSKKAMTALKEKLRLTERQRLRKIDEHEKYENILNRREKSSENESESDDESNKD